jgi:hypothetical protein
MSISASASLQCPDLCSRFVCLPQIVQFIIQSTGMAAGPSAGSLASLPVTGGFCDPFTGGVSGRLSSSTSLQFQYS